MLNYNAPLAGQESSIDAGGNSNQMQSFLWIRNSIITARKDMYFTQIAATMNMPKHYGKKIKVLEYYPVLDDRNVNDQGLDASGATYAGGNLYGSSRDIGKISDRLPTLGENGGRVNRVGLTRIEREGEIHSYGVFVEFSQEALDFDSDDQLMKHLSTELMNSAVQMNEAMIQMDLLAACGTVIYPGIAANDGQVTGEGPAADRTIVSYADLIRLDQVMTDNRTPRQTKMLKGSSLIDTRTVGSCRVLYIGNEILPTLKELRDPFDKPVYVPAVQYAAQGTVLEGEVGMLTCGDFRLVLVPEMLHWAAAGAAATVANPGYRSSNKGAGEKYDIFPMLVVGDDAFTTVGFQATGASAKVNVITQMPGKESASHDDPFGKTGRSSLSWYYGSLTKRPERLGLIKTVAPR